MAEFKSGFVAIIGRTNVGKSTLINKLVGEKVAITVNKSQTTRTAIRAIVNRENSQIIFIDTPGVHKPKTKLGETMVETAYEIAEDVDIILFIVDCSKKEITKGDRIILEKIKEWWLKFTTKQKTLLISITAVVILALVILAVVMTKPTMVQLITCEDATQASSVKDLLDGNSIDYEVSSDGMTFSVNAKNQADANILLGSNSIPTNGFTIDDALSGSISTTEADKSKRYQVFLEDKFAKELENMDLIKSADVNLNIPEDDGTLVTRNQESYASVKLELNGEMSEDQAASLARYIATEIGNSSTDNITIIDSNSNLLFAGGEESTAIGTASTQLSYQTKKETQVKKAVTDVIKGTDLYDTIDVGLNLKLNFDQVTTNETNYSAQGDRDEGLITHEDRYQSDSTGGTSGTPTLMEMEQLMYFQMEAHQKALLQMIPLTVHWMKRTPRPLAL